jgi:hypothetical protein
LARRNGEKVRGGRRVFAVGAGFVCFGNLVLGGCVGIYVTCSKVQNS